MDMEEGDTIEVFTQQSGGDGKSEQCRNVSGVEYLCWKETNCNFAKPSSIYHTPLMSKLTSSKYKRRQIQKHCHQYPIFAFD